MKILFISFFFPPVKAIASVRTWNICKGLLATGHSVRSVTVDDRDMPEARIEPPKGWAEFKDSSAYSEIRVPSPWPSLNGIPPRLDCGKVRYWVTKWLTRLASRLLIWSGFDPMLPWAFSAWRSIREETDVDLVLVSGGPFSSFLPGYLLSRSLKCPLVLDYRDVWNNAPHIKYRFSTRLLERIFLRQARFVTSVSPSCLSAILGSEQRPSAVITNGVSDNVYAYRNHHHREPEPVIVYAGAFYPPKRSIEPFFAAYSNFCKRYGYGVRFIYLGPSAAYVEGVAHTYGLSDAVDCRGVVSHEEALQLQAQSLCTLVVTTVDELAEGADRGVLTGKLFEAIELARNVMVISPANSDVRALTAHIPHVGNFTGAQVDLMADWLKALVDSPVGVSKCPSHFSWQKLSAKYAELMCGEIDK